MTGTELLDLDAIEQRAKSATEGPWVTVNRFYVEAPTVQRDVTQTAEWESSGIDREEDAEFIAHARTDVPALLAEVRRLREESVTLRAATAERDRYRSLYRREFTENVRLRRQIEEEN